MNKVCYIIISCLIVSQLFCLNLYAQVQTNNSNFLITDDGTQLFTKKSGEGSICIFIHGGPGAWSKSFEKLKGNTLEQKLTMVYYDQRGSGRSDKAANGDYSLDRMIEDIELIRKHYNADKVFLLAHSFGGILAVNYARKYPNHVKGLILANTTLNLKYSLMAQLNYINKLLGSNFYPSDCSPSSIMSTFRQAKAVLAEKKLNYKMISDNKENVALLNRIDRDNPSSYDFAQTAFQLNDYWKDYTKITHEIDVPILTITGKKDHSVGVNHYLQFAFKNQFVKKIDSGHLLYYEHNRAFSKAIFRFIKN